MSCGEVWTGDYGFVGEFGFKLDAGRELCMYERGGSRLLLVILVVSNVPGRELLRYY